ncbi:MAG: YidC/Oxa1 family membrane protein insertase [Erysipelotrichaceae bacterium]|nr:YidC/Oxa1 family membrane protein insertase [Erysipelotrichaceae bacterium]
MTNFFYRNRHKLILVIFLALILFTLTSCRMDSGSWNNKPYTTYKAEWVDLWNGGSGFWNTLWGWPINLISYPIAWMCSGIGKGLGNSFFWGIFFTTLIVRTLAWPIYSKQNGMSLKMQLMQPEMAKVQRKYGNRKDPQSQRAMQMEMMKLYKKYKVNPLGCFGTMFLQFPIFMSMYEVVQRINATTTTVVDGAVNVTVAGKFALLNTKVFGFFELNTSFFEATAVKDKIFAVVVALIFGGLQILQQKLSSRPPKYQKQHPNANSAQQNQQQKQMKTMMLVMNIMFVFMCLNSTSLAIYWLIGAVYQIFQSFIGRKINEYQYYKTQQKNNI